MVGVAMDGNSMTYSNVTQDSIQFVRYTLRPWLSRVEQALSMLLPRGQNARFILDDMLRADTATRYAAYETGLRAGFLTINEVRTMEDMTNATSTEPMPNG
jgi:phage portal protein BeeE